MIEQDIGRAIGAILLVVIVVFVILIVLAGKE